MRVFASSDLQGNPAGVEIVAAPESIPESVVERIRQIAESHPEIDVEIGGGLADEIEQSKTSRGFSLDKYVEGIQHGKGVGPPASWSRCKKAKRSPTSPRLHGAAGEKVFSAGRSAPARW